MLVANGPGRSLAKAACETAIAKQRPTAIISTGFCGGLDPALKPAQLFVANRVISADNDSEFIAAVPGNVGDTAIGSIVCGDRVIVTREEKAALRNRTGARVVDMESFAVAECAKRLGVPFYCVRVLSDTASETFPIDFNCYRDQAGRFKIRAIAIRALLSPFSVLPELIRFQRRCAAASDVLGEFLVNCRFTA
jgi:adenosylhomocysteine nucleosidase